MAARRAEVAAATVHRFPVPWSVRELEQAFRIEDATGQAVAYTYFRHDANEARQGKRAHPRRRPAGLQRTSHGCLRC